MRASGVSTDQNVSWSGIYRVLTGNLSRPAQTTRIFPSGGGPGVGARGERGYFVLLPMGRAKGRRRAAAPCTEHGQPAQAGAPEEALRVDHLAEAAGVPQNSVFDLKGTTLSSKLDSLFEASWRDGSHSPGVEAAMRPKTPGLRVPPESDPGRGRSRCCY